eukprot:CAMPEP_0184314228 /NCGR_PEP_ID=MMETSP1049-20130417/72546_1 /TAXON_ID=77928 /ORGANISM="Proteomonas sulcata, Strain CCMP704" /LENGTH=91 /DNA_ID=CAMNT_0026632041 /DNA_START=53 /DNA_END=328 /DNA_ORIENTATION=+
MNQAIIHILQSQLQAIMRSQLQDQGPPQLWTTYSMTSRPKAFLDQASTNTRPSRPHPGTLWHPLAHISTPWQPLAPPGTPLAPTVHPSPQP